MNEQIAKQHRTKMFKLIEDFGQTITVTPPGTRSVATNDTEKVFGVTSYTEGEGTPVEVHAWVHQGPVPSSAQGTSLQGLPALVGKLAESDLILSMKLSEALVDLEKPYGRTIFEQAKSVEVTGSDFEVTGVFRSGLAPLGPYILWVGLRNSGE